MELRRLTIFIALFVLAYVAQCSEGRHAMKRQVSEEVNYDDILADEASDDEAQNDADGGNDADEDADVMAEIVTKPRSYNATIGHSVRLECAYTPDDNGVVVRWTKNNTMYFMGTKKPFDFNVNLGTNDHRFTIAANSTDLVISNVTPADSGEYKCEIQQTDYPAVAHTVNVLERPKIIRLTASDGGRVVEGNDLVLTCEVEGSPPPQILWSREVEQGNKRLQEKDGEFKPNSVLIKNVNKHHSGKYYCYAFNSIGNNQKDVEVTVMGKPRVHVHKYVINSAINVEAVLECSVKDHLASYIRWYKDGLPIEESSRQYSINTQGQNSSLTITPKADEDFGTFTCEAENDLGKHNKSIELVQSPVVEEFGAEGPKLTWRVHSHQPVEKMEIQLRDISGDSEWQAFDVPLPERRNHQFEVIYNLMEKQLEAGTYEASVRVKNDKSWSVQTDPAFVEIVSNQPQLIQASVYHPGNDAYTTRPATVLMATTFMYLLVRML